MKMCNRESLLYIRTYIDLTVILFKYGYLYMGDTVSLLLFVLLSMKAFTEKGKLIIGRNNGYVCIIFLDLTIPVLLVRILTVYLIIHAYNMHM